MKYQTIFLLNKHQRNVHGMQVSTNQNTSSMSNQSNQNASGGGGSNSVVSSQQHGHGNASQSSSNALVAQNKGQNQGGPAGEDEPNMVECDMCGKMVRETSLAAHKKRHELAEKRPFKCEICGKVS